jgi:hypothetical protein
MSKLAFLIGDVSLVGARKNLSIRPFTHATRSMSGRFMPLSHWLPTLWPSVTRKPTGDTSVDAVDSFYIGVGDQFDDDRRRIHIVR